MLQPSILAQSFAAQNGSEQAAKAQAGGWYSALVIGGILILIAVFAFLAKMRRDS